MRTFNFSAGTPAMLVKDGRRAKLVEWGRPAATVEIITHQSPERSPRTGSGSRLG